MDDRSPTTDRRRASFDKETVEFVERYVVAPVIMQFTERMNSIEESLTVGLSRCADRLEDALKQTSATMRAMQDPETGFISRAEAGLIKKNFEDNLAALDESTDDKIRSIHVTASAVAVTISLAFGILGFVFGGHH